MKRSFIFDQFDEFFGMILLCLASDWVVACFNDFICAPDAVSFFSAALTIIRLKHNSSTVDMHFFNIVSILVHLYLIVI